MRSEYEERVRKGEEEVNRVRDEGEAMVLEERR